MLQLFLFSSYLGITLNYLGSIFIGALTIEGGLCLWQQRKFSGKHFWAIVLLIIGIRAAWMRY